MEQYEDDSTIYNPFAAPASSENPTTAYKKQRDLQHALGYDNSVSPDMDMRDYVHSREESILKYLAAHSENSHTFRIKCDMPGDESHADSKFRKFFEIHYPHYIKFTRVPDINKCTFGEGNNKKTFSELFDPLDSIKKEEAEKAIQAAFEKMYDEHLTSLPFTYKIEGQETEITTQINLGYSLVIENTDDGRMPFFATWNPREYRNQVRANELKEEKQDREDAAAAGIKYEDEKIDNGIMRMRWISPLYNAVPPDDMLSPEELKLKKENPEEFMMKYCQIPPDKLKNMSKDELKEFDKKILERKYEMFQRLDHTGQFSDNLFMVETKDKLAEKVRNAKHEAERTVTNEVIRSPLTGSHEGGSFFERLMGRMMGMMRYR